MRIEQLQTSPDRMGRYQVRFENGKTVKLYRQTVEDFGLYTGMELPEERLAELARAAGEMSAKMRAVRIVSAASVSKQELESRLVRKGETPAQSAQAVAWMADLHLVDDRQTARQIVSSCIRRGYGLHRAKQALYEKRIPKTYWEEALADYPDQAERILDFLRSRLGEESDEKDIKRAVDALLRRGHSYAAVRSALKELSLEAEGMEEF